ncbi:MAG: hypothetical protein LUE08_05535, partial [Akkermansiaceae bacterium]|nr:hypothetical protein [Akkermansiaceae bacterium]
MKLHLPLKLRAALAACLSAVSPFVPTAASGSLAVGAAVFALASAAQGEDYADVTYSADTTTISTGNASLTADVEDAPDASSGAIDLNDGTDAYTSTLTISGGGSTISTTATNGGSGGRVTISLSGEALSADLECLVFTGGIEANLGSVFSSSDVIANESFYILFDNASFFIDNGSTFAADFEVGSGGVRLNGSSSASYYYTGKITGSGNIYALLYNSDQCQYIQGDVSEYTGCFGEIASSTQSNAKTWYFGSTDGSLSAEEVTNGVVGGNIGRSTSARSKVTYNYADAYEVTGCIYGQSLTVAGGEASFTGSLADSTAITVSEGASATFKNSGGVTSSGTVTVAGTATFDTTADLAALSVTGTAVFNGASTAVSLTAAEGSTLTVGESGSLTVSGDAALAGTLTNNGSLTLGGTLSLTSVSIVNEGTVTLAESLVLDLSGLTAEENEGVYTYTLFTGSSAVDLSSLTTDALTGVTVAGKEWSFNDDGTISYVITSSEVVWAGTESSHAWDAESANWTGGAVFTAGDSVAFDSTAAYKTVSLSGDYEVTNITVSDAYTFLVEDAASITVYGEVTGGEGSLTVTGGGNLTVSTALALGLFAVEIAEGTTLTLADAVTDEDDFSAVTGAGTLALTGGTLSASSVSDALSNLSLAGMTLSVGEETTLSLNLALDGAVTVSLVADAAVTGDVSGEGATVTVTVTGSGCSLILGEGTAGGEEGEDELASVVLGDLVLSDGVTFGVGDYVTGTISNTDTEYVNGYSFTITTGTGSTLTDGRYYNLTNTTLTISGTGVYEIDGLTLSANGQSATYVVVEAGATLHITGTTTSITGGEGSLMLSNWSASNTFDVYGTLISEAGISGRDGTGTLNVHSGGTLTLNAGLTASSRGTNVLNVYAGGTLNLGDQESTTAGALTVNVYAGAVVNAVDEETTVARTIVFGAADEENAEVTLNADEGLALIFSTAQTLTNVAVTGAGVVSFTGALTSSDSDSAIRVTDGATLKLSGGNGSWAGTTTVESGGTLVALGSSVASMGGSGSTVTVAEGGVLTVGSEADGTAAVNYYGNIDGAGDVVVYSGSTLKLFLGGAETLSYSGTLTVQSGSALSMTNSSTKLANASLTMEEGSSLTLTGVTSMTVGGALTLGDNLTFSLSSLTLDASVSKSYTLATARSIVCGDLTTISLENYTIDEATAESYSLTLTVQDNGDGTSSLVLLLTNSDLYWVAGDGTWSAASGASQWALASGASATNDFLNGASVFFDQDVSAAISVEGAVSVDGMTVSAGSYTFTGEDGAALTVTGTLAVTGSAAAIINVETDLSAAEVTVDEGASLTLGEGADIGELTNSGSLTVSTGDLTVETATAAGGTVTVGGDLILSDGENSFENLSVAGSVSNSGMLTLNGAASVGGFADGVSGDLVVNEGASLVVTGSGAVTVSSLSGAGTLTAESASLTLADGSEIGSLTATDITLEGALTVTGTLTVSNITLNTLSGGTVSLIAGTLAGGTGDTVSFYIGDELLQALGLKDGSSCTIASAVVADGTSLSLGDEGTVTLSGYTYSLTYSDSSISITAALAGSHWTGTGTWGTDSNWSGGSTPGASDAANFTGEGSSEVTLEGAVTAGSVNVDTSSVGSVTYTFTGSGSLTTDTLSVTAGGLVIGTSVTVNEAAVVGADGSLSVNTSGTLEAGSLTVNEGGSFANEGTTTVSGALTADEVANTGSLSVGDGTDIGTLTGGGSLTTAGTAAVGSVSDTLTSLTIDGGSMTVSTGDLTVGELANSGTLTVDGALTVNTAAASGGTVSASSVDLSSAAGSEFTSITTDALTISISESNLTAASLTVETLSGLTADSITLTLSGLDELTISEGDYYLVTVSSGSADLTLSGEVVAWFSAEGYTASLTFDASSQTRSVAGAGSWVLTLTEATDEGRTWYTSSATTGAGYTVGTLTYQPDGSTLVSISGTDVYTETEDVLSTVQNVYADGDLSIDLTESDRESADDALVLNNLTQAEADEDITITIVGNGTASGTEGDLVILAATEDAAAGNERSGAESIEAESVTVRVTGEYSLTVGDFTLTGAELAVELGGDDAQFTVSSLTGDEDSILSGTICIDGATGTAGVYSGSYSADGAAVYAVGEAAAQTLAVDESSSSLTVGGTAGTITLDYTAGDAEIAAISAAGATIVLNNAAADSGVNTLTLTEESSMEGGTLALSIDETAGTNENVIVAQN